MPNNVIANGLEVCCKSDSGQTVNIATDICLSPPSPPAGPIPVPYPTTSMGSDTTAGTKTVQIGGKEVMLKNESSLKKCTGDEAATKSLGMGLITHNITGPCYFSAWSMTVKFEDQNAVRNTDITTHNHASMPGDSMTFPYLTGADMKQGGPCDDNIKNEKTDCAEYKPHGPKESPCPKPPPPVERPDPIECGDVLTPKEQKQLTKLVDFTSMKRKPNVPLPAGMSEDAFSELKDKYKTAERYQKDYRPKLAKSSKDFADEVASDPCMRARRCMLAPYSPTTKQHGCCPGQTPHHLVEAGSFFHSGRGTKETSVSLNRRWKYKASKAPCICVEGPNQYTATHAMMHTQQSNLAAVTMKNKHGKMNYTDAANNGAEAVEAVFPESDCKPACIKAQLKNYHMQARIPPNSNIRPIATGDGSNAAAEKSSYYGKLKEMMFKPRPESPLEGVLKAVTKK